MTLKELLEWAEKNDCLDCDVCVQYRDGGVFTMERTLTLTPRVEEINNRDVIVL